MPYVMPNVMTVQDYLDRHYVTADTFAQMCGLSREELDHYVKEGVLAAPSYSVSGTVLHSAAFGDLDAGVGTRDGDYFHPGMAKWVKRVHEAGDLSQLRALFQTEMAIALADADQSTWRMADAFDESGNPITAGLQKRLDNMWSAFMRGIFGLCVAHPNTAQGIATKEILQEKLTAITANGTELPEDARPRIDLADTISRYAEAAMPFAPPEYPTSSRKRLADDYRARFEDALR